MKNYILILCSCLSMQVFSQQNDFAIVPGISAGKVKLGMTEAQVHAVLKGKFTVNSYAQELKDFASSSSNYHLDSIPQFVIGFDKSLTASSEALENAPVYNMYFLHDKLMYIGVTSYSIDSVLKASVLMKDKIRFDMLQEDCMNILGDDFMSIGYGSYSGDHVYYKEGFEVTYDDSFLTFIAIFKADKNYPAKLAAKSKKLMAEQVRASH
jgi:hypothetical protein